MKRSALASRMDFGLGLPGSGERVLGGYRDVRIDLWIQLIDATQSMLDDFDRRYGSRFVQAAQFRDADSGSNVHRSLQSYRLSPLVP